MGIGRSLLLRLTAGRQERTAVLSTADAPIRARRLYRVVGFTDLLTDFRFSGGEPPYAVMGARLPLWPRRARLPPVAEAEQLVDLHRRAGRVERDEVQAGRVLVEQPRATAWPRSRRRCS